MDTINGNSVNHEIASFLEPNGIELVDSIKDEMKSIHPIIVILLQVMMFGGIMILKV